MLYSKMVSTNIEDLVLKLKCSDGILYTNRITLQKQSTTLRNLQKSIDQSVHKIEIPFPKLEVAAVLNVSTDDSLLINDTNFDPLRFIQVLDWLDFDPKLYSLCVQTMLTTPKYIKLLIKCQVYANNNNISISHMLPTTPGYEDNRYQLNVNKSLAISEVLSTVIQLKDDVYIDETINYDKLFIFVKEITERYFTQLLTNTASLNLDALTISSLPSFVKEIRRYRELNLDQKYEIDHLANNFEQLHEEEMEKEDDHEMGDEFLQELHCNLCYTMFYQNYPMFNYIHNMHKSFVKDELPNGDCFCGSAEEELNIKYGLKLIHFAYVGSKN